MKSVLLGNMACFADVGDPNRRYQRFLKVGKPPFKCLIESTLLFDQVVIPTNDFMPLSLMGGVLGNHALLRLLDEDTVKFSRFRGSVGYIGNGGGVCFFDLSSAEQRPKYISAPFEEAARLAIDAVNNPDLDKKKIGDLAIRATSEFSLEDKKIKEVTYGEIKKSPELITAKGLVDLRRLKGIQPNQVRVLSGVLDEGKEDDIAQVLRVAQAFVETQAAANCGCDDIYTSDQVGQLFKRALTRVSERTSPNGTYVQLRELANLPDIGELALQDNNILHKVLDLRNSSAGWQFRQWFHENVRIDTEKVAHEYIKLLQQIPGAESAPARAIRFFAQVGVAAASAITLNEAVGFAVGVAANAIDSFLVQRIFRGSSPKVFLERLREVIGQSDKN